MGHRDYDSRNQSVYVARGPTTLGISFMYDLPLGEHAGDATPLNMSDKLTDLNAFFSLQLIPSMWLSWTSVSYIILLWLRLLHMHKPTN